MKQKTEIIAAILTNNEEDVIKKVDLVSPYLDWIQLDVCDGRFVSNTSWGQPEKIQDIAKKINIEVHLMIENPENSIDEWIASGVKRIYIHYESTKNPKPILQKIKEAELEAGIAVLPETSIDCIDTLHQDLNCILLFSGSLGHYGGEFLQQPTLSKISTLQKKYNDIIIEVDGGINPPLAKMLAKKGVSNFVSGGFIFKSEDPINSIKELKSAVYN